MAKSRSRTKSSRASTKRARPKKRARKAPSTKPKQIELGNIREQLKRNVDILGSAIGASPEPRPELEEALKRMSRWLDDIGDICGSQMMIPIP